MSGLWRRRYYRIEVNIRTIRKPTPKQKMWYYTAVQHVSLFPTKFSLFFIFSLVSRRKFSLSDFCFTFYVASFNISKIVKFLCLDDSSPNFVLHLLLISHTFYLLTIVLFSRFPLLHCLEEHTVYII